jgi:hypothetical protein
MLVHIITSQNIFIFMVTTIKPQSCSLYKRLTQVLNLEPTKSSSSIISVLYDMEQICPVSFTIVPFQSLVHIILSSPLHIFIT